MNELEVVCGAEYAEPDLAYVGSVQPRKVGQA